MFGPSKAVKKLLKKSDPRDALWPELRKRRDEGDEVRRPYERQWLLTLAFLSGRQYSFYNQSAEMVQHIKTLKGRLRVIDNKILPRYRKQVSRMIRSNPVISVLPASDSAEDIRAAKVGTKALRYFWRQGRMRKKVHQLAGWIYGTGNAFLEDKWNRRIGPTQVDSEGNVNYLGDVDCAIWSPFEVGVPAYGINPGEIADMPWITLSRFQTLDWIRSTFKENGERVTPEERPSAIADVSLLFGVQDSGTVHKQEGAVVTMLRLKPCAEFPKGLQLIGANGIVLSKEDYPYESFHIEHFKDIEIPGLFWGMATSEAAIWLQKIHNRTLSDIAEHNRVMARGKWLVPRRANMETVPDDTIGQRILYDPVMGAKPEHLTLKGLPNSYALALDIVSRSLMELYHQHEVTQGTNKSDIRSGDMVQLLLEQDDAGNLPTHAIFEEALRAVMTRVLQRIRQGYTTDRIISVVEGGRDDVLVFKGLELRDSKDVVVSKESSLPDSKTARQAQILDRYEKGLYGDMMQPGTRERVLRMLDEVPDTIQDIYGEAFQDRRVAQMENDAIRKQPGTLLMVNPYDNHAVHLDEHQRTRKEEEYQRLRLTNPQLFIVLETGFVQHEVQHQKYIAAQRKQQLEEMAMLKGGKEV